MTPRKTAAVTEVTVVLAERGSAAVVATAETDLYGLLRRVARLPAERLVARAAMRLVAGRVRADMVVMVATAARVARRERRGSALQEVLVEVGVQARPALEGRGRPPDPTERQRRLATA
jgi:hypothetical protein